MGIMQNDITVLEAILNQKLSKENMSFKMSVHFVKDRMNDPRNTPSITITELQSIFNRLLTVHISALSKLKHNDTFNIRCLKSDINIPCAVEKTKQADGRVHQKNIAITVMRKKNFKAKDAIEFKV
jgi:hypothetical protein